MENYEHLQQFTESVRQPKYIAKNDHHTSNDTDTVTLDIGGRIFKTSYASMKSIPNSFLSTLNEKSKHFNQAKKLYYIDRDAELFPHILSAHREGELHVPKNVCVMRLKKEMMFWGIPHHLLSPCCWKCFFSLDNDLDTLNTLLAYRPKKRPLGSVSMGTDSLTTTDSNTNNVMPNGEPALKDRIWVFLDEPSSSTAAKIWCFFYVCVVIVSAIVSIIWLYPGLRVDPYLPSLTDIYNVTQLNSMSADLVHLTTHNRKVTDLIFADPHLALLVIDTVCTIYFLLETIVHFFFCPNKVNYVKNPYNSLKVFLCASMLISLVFEFRKDKLDNIYRVYCYLIFKSINSLRLLLLFRLQKLYVGLHIMCLAVGSSFKDLMLLLFGICIAITIYGGLIFSMEIETDMFPDTHTSMWWALITMTTVGYGDFYPTIPLGYSVGFICALNGLIIIALPIASIASNFSELYGRYKDYKMYNEAVRQDDEREVEGPVGDSKKTIETNYD